MTAALAFALALQPAAQPADTYDALVARGVALARSGDHASAEDLLRRARSLDASRPEARVELGGLRFLQGRYAEAVQELRPALRVREDAHARDLLAAALHLGGRPEEALDEWNRLRRPVLRNVHLNGIHETRARLVVPQMTFLEGALLTRDQLRATRLRLKETGVFDRVTLRPIPLGGGAADLEVSVVERHGLDSPPELVATTASKAAQRTVWLRYDNAAGTGLGLTASYRWQSTQPRAAVRLAWPRPLGLGATLLAEGSWERAHYDLAGERVRLRTTEATLGLRRVLDPATVGELRWHGGRWRISDGDGSILPAASHDGRLSGLSLAAERQVVDGWRHRLDARAEAFAAGAALGSELEFSSARVRLRQALFLSPPERSTVERSVLAAQLVLATASRRAPLDVLFVPGAASEMDYPLRAHRARRGGVWGQTPIARSLQLLNLEWRVRLARWGAVQGGAVLFYDAAQVGGAVITPEHRLLQDVGVGLRLGALGVLVRVDAGWALTGRHSFALTAGLGQAF